MNRWAQSFGSALVTRELLEQAARKRTYVLRGLFVAGLSLPIIGSYHSQWQSSIGGGDYLFRLLVFAQMIGTYLLLPASMSGALAQEKERGTLDILLLTHLGPRKIIQGKLLGRLIPFLSLQVASLPVFALAYSLGGLSQTYLWCGVYLSFLTVLQVGSLALLFSSYCATTGGALVMTYVAGAASGMRNGRRCL